MVEFVAPKCAVQGGFPGCLGAFDLVVLGSGAVVGRLGPGEKEWWGQRENQTHFHQEAELCVFVESVLLVFTYNEEKEHAA